MAVWVFALTAAAQQAQDKPSPVPRRPARPSLATTRPEKSGQPPSRNTKPDLTNAPRKFESERFARRPIIEGDRHRLLLLFKRERRVDSQRDPTQ